MRTSVSSATLTALAMLSSGFLASNAACGAEAQILNGEKVAYSENLTITTPVGSATDFDFLGSRVGLEVRNGSEVSGNAALTIGLIGKGSDAVTDALRVSDSALIWVENVSLTADGAALSVLSSKVTITGTTAEFSTLKSLKSEDTCGVLLLGASNVAVTADTVTIGAQNASSAFAISAEEPSGKGETVFDTLQVRAKDIQITASGEEAVGVSADWGAQMTLVAEKSLTIEAASTESRAIGLKVSGWSQKTGSVLTADAETIVIRATQTADSEINSEVHGIRARNDDANLHKTLIGTEAAKNITIEATSVKGASAVHAV